MLVAAMKPCPCGYYGDPIRECRCSVRQIEHYRQRIFGPLLDRIYIHVEMSAAGFRELQAPGNGGESSATNRGYLEHAMHELHFSARDRILKVARTLADLGNSEPIRPDDIPEAIQFRSLDRKLFT